MARMRTSDSELRAGWYLGGWEAPAAEEDVRHSLKGDKWQARLSEAERAYRVEDSRDRCTRRELLWTERRSYNEPNLGGQAYPAEGFRGACVGCSESKHEKCEPDDAPNAGMCPREVDDKD